MWLDICELRRTTWKPRRKVLSQLVYDSVPGYNDKRLLVSLKSLFYITITMIFFFSLHGNHVTMRIIEAQQAKLCNTYKNTRLKLLKTNAALWFNKICSIKHLKPNYINFKTNGNKLQDGKTTSNALKFRINQEIKFLYCKKQNLNTRLYRIHLICANYICSHIFNTCTLFFFYLYTPYISFYYSPTMQP
jgi:hypothetical protein